MATRAQVTSSNAQLRTLKHRWVWKTASACLLILSFGSIASPLQAARASDYHCPSRHGCLFTDVHFSGIKQQFSDGIRYQNVAGHMHDRASAVANSSHSNYMLLGNYVGSTVQHSRYYRPGQVEADLSRVGYNDIADFVTFGPLR